MSAARVRVPRAAWLAAGIAVAAGSGSAGLSPLAAAGAGCLLLSLALARWRAWRPELRNGLLAAAIGLLLAGMRLAGFPGPGAPPALPDGGTGPWTAVVDSVGSPRDGDQVARLRLEIDGASIDVAATLPGYPQVRAGDLVEVEGRLRPPPEDDPYGDYLRRTGASGSLDGRRIRIVALGPGTSLQALRDGAGDALRDALPEPEAGLAAGILVGLRERVDRDLASDFATAGASHIVAISGWNIAIVAGIVGAILRGRPRRLVAVVVGGTIVGYVIAAGASPSVVRAAVMASVVLVARESGRAGRAPAALAWAVAILLLLDPEMIADAGFRLSVAATAGLLAWANPLGGWIGRLWGGRVPRWLAESLGISLAAQAATLPDVLATFARLSLVAPAVNLLVVPMVPVGMAGGLCALVGGVVAEAGGPSWIATLAGLPGWFVLHVIVAIVRFGADLPLAAVSLPESTAGPAGAAAAGAIGGFLWWRQRRAAKGARRPPRAPDRHDGQRARMPQRRPGLPQLGAPARALLVAGVLVALVGATVVVDATGRATRLTVLDVGQGDAILLESQSGARMLVDGGPDPARLLVELGDRIPPWDRRIDVVVLTHPHEDHVAGLVQVLDRYRVGRVYEPGMHGPGPGWDAWNARLLQGSPPRGTLAAGQRIVLGEIRLEVLWPEPGSVPEQPGATGRVINDTSIVLLGAANGRRFLLTGDAEDDVDPHLLGRGLPNLDVLKVAHHGSATATSQALLDATRPSIAVISVGAGNDYGHPAPSTLARLRSVDARVYRTDHDGTISFDLAQSGVAVRVTGGRSLASTRGPGELRTGYDRAHDDPGPPRGRPPARLPGASRVVPAARVRGGGRGRVARAADSRSRRARGRGTGRSGGAAARRGQAARRPDARPPPSRRGVG